MRKGDRNNGIAVHAWENEHEVDWSNARILKCEDNYWRRRIVEAIEIQRHHVNMNLDCGLTLGEIWNPRVLK